MRTDHYKVFVHPTLAPSTRIPLLYRILVFVLIACSGMSAFAAETMPGDADTRIRQQLVIIATPDLALDAYKAAFAALVDTEDVRLNAILEDYKTRSLAILNGEPVLIPTVITAADETKLALPLDPLTREPVSKEPLPLSAYVAHYASRNEMVLANKTLMLLRFADPDPDKRLQAVNRAGDGVDATAREGLERRKPHETDRRILRAIEESLAFQDLGGTDDALRIAAANRLADLKSERAAVRLAHYLEAKPQLSAEVAQTMRQARARLESWGTIAAGLKHLFSGLSLGSILIIMALGLSIIFGLMGVINMAHGEMMMIGAYSMWAVQQLLGAAITRGWLPAGLMEWSLIISIPAAFVMAGAVGWLVEALVIRWLYGRPLDTLLATVGVSYVLVQAVRMIAGDSNAVSSPTWLQGGWEVLPSVILPYNRLFIIVLCAGIVVGMHLLLNRTKMGLILRATTQNRVTAQTLGVRTRRVDGMTFALGCGIAGMAGCALTLTDILKPDMGSSYIIESFMVVVAGGVGKLAGAVLAGLGLGFFNKLLEPAFAAVWAKVWMIAAVIILLQWRPSGLFPAKGRLADT